MVSARSAILIFVRTPEPGRVKTRLAAEIGAEAALRVYVRLARHATGEALMLAPDVAVRIHFTPADASGAGQWLGPGPAYIPQAEGDLGERLERAFAEAFDAGFERVVVIGSDLPDLSSALLRRALGLLDRYEAVLGPARDGGYYLLGLRQLVTGVFRDIPWSTPAVFGTTADRLRSAAIEPAILETLRDVDHAADLPDEWRAEYGVMD